MRERTIRLCVAILIFVVAPAATDAAGQTQSQQEPQEPPTEEEEEEEPIPSYSETIVVTASRTEHQIINAPGHGKRHYKQHD